MKVEYKKKRASTAVIILFVLGLFLFTPKANAQELLAGDTIPAGETVEHDVVLNGDNILVAGDVDGDVFAVGGTIVIDGEVTGSLFTIGSRVEVNGEVGGSMYAVGSGIRINNDADINHSLYVLSISVHTDRESTIGRQISGLSLGAILQGSTGESNNLVIGLIEVLRVVFIRMNEVNSGKPAALLPSGAFASSVEQGGLLYSIAATPAEQNAGLAVPFQQTSTANQAGEAFGRFMVGIISFLIVGGLAIWLRPQLFTTWTTQLQQRPVATFGWGIVAYIVGFLGSLLLLLIIIAIGIGIILLTLVPLGVTWLGLSISTLSVAFWTFLLFVSFMSKAIVGYVIGYQILKRLYSRATERPIWPLLLGLIIYTLFCMVPYLGWAVAFIVTCLGLGAVWLSWQQRGSGKGTNAEPLISEETPLDPAAA